MDSCVQSDALVFFGATGDLAYKKIFPALQEMIKRGTLAVPVIGVAKSGWNLPQLQSRARDSLEQRDPRPVTSRGVAFSRESPAPSQFGNWHRGRPFHQEIDEGADLEG